MPKRLFQQLRPLQANLRPNVLSVTYQPTINFAPTQPMINNLQILNSSNLPITNQSHSISSPLNLCFSPTTNYRRAPITTKPKPKEKPLPQSPLPGMHFWQRTLPHDLQKETWSFHKYDGSEEYIILKETADPIFNFIVKDLSTGKEFEMQLTEHNRIKSQY